MFTKTTRLIIRDFEREDFASLLAISGDPEVFRLNDFVPADEDKLREWLDETIVSNAQQPRSSHMCAILLTATNALIGWIGFGVPSEPGHGDIDFGYALNRAYWNQGYTTEAVRGMLAYCFDVVGARVVTAYHMDLNPASGRVMRKAGMHLDAAQMTGRTNGEVHYIVTADEWRTSRDSRES